MYRSRPMNLLCAALFGMAAAVAANGGAAQEREVVSSQIEVSQSEASLELEFAGGEVLMVSFANGVATVGSEVLGSYEAGDDSDRAWRDLLASILSLSDGPLARELEAWAPDPGLAAPELALLDRVDQALADALTAGERPLQTRSERTSAEEFLAVVARSEGIAALGAALAEVDLESVDVRVGQDYSVSEGDAVDGSLFVVDGRLQVDGLVRGDVILLDATLSLGESGRIDGDVRHARSEIEQRGGEVRGELVDLAESSGDSGTRTPAVAEPPPPPPPPQLAEAARSEGESAGERPTSHGRTPSEWRVVRAVGEAVETIVTFVVLGCLTLLLTRFAGLRLDTVTREVGHRPGRAAAVGFAGGFLVVPVFLIGCVVLTASVVGIPVLFAWVPLYPLAIVLAAFAGYVAASHHVGRWVLDQEIAWLDRVDRNRDTHVRLTGLAALMLPFAVGSLLGAIPLIGWIGGIVEALAVLACLAAVTTGFGAVIITRAGKYATAWSDRFAEDMDIPVDWSPVDEREDDPGADDLGADEEEER